MQDIGQDAAGAATGGLVTCVDAPDVVRVRVIALFGALCALLPSLVMWGFTVDDALIPIRYAHHLLTGHGYRFNVGDPPSDGVTPLPWAFLISSLGGSDPMITLVRAKVLGVVVWTLTGGALGFHVAPVVARARAPIVASLLVMALAFPIGAWAASGMETGVATALATWASIKMRRPTQAALLGGLAASLRPEMVVWAVAIAAGSAIMDGAAKRERKLYAVFQDVGIALVPFLTCCVVRLVLFGRPAPLAVLAKPSDFSHGGLYVAAASFVVLTPILMCAPIALLRARNVALALTVAFVAHAVAVAAAGGDWMAYARLIVPVAPSLVVAFASLVEYASWKWTWGRLLVATAFGALVAIRAAPAGRGVLEDREDLVTRSRPVLASSRIVAALDVGWVSASTNARIVDLAGLTDLSIALLPGGHTSKRVDTAMLLDRGVDTFVAYSDLRIVEQRILRSELFQARFVEVVRLPVGARGMFYTIYRRRD